MSSMAGMNESTLILDRMVRAVEKVRELLLRATGTPRSAGVQYAVIGGNAVAAWAATIDESAVRNTRDVDVLLERQDLDKATIAMEAVGFRLRQSMGVTVFLDGPDGKFRDAVRVIFANEKGREENFAPAASVADSEWMGQFHAISLEGLVRMKLTSFRDKDRTHLRDMLEVGLLDASWYSRCAPELAI